MKTRRVSFHFDERSLVLMKNLEARGMKFTEVKLPEKTLIIPKAICYRSLICPSWEIRAFLAGNKSQIRRPMKPQPHPDFLARGVVGVVPQWPLQDGVRWFMADGMSELVKCPLGAPGDRLAVKEVFTLQCDIDGDDPPFDDGRPIRRAESEDSDWSWLQPHYKATDPPPALCCDRLDCRCADEPHCHWRSAVVMPRWASRVTLEVVKVLAPQRGKITEEDAKAEGAERLGPEWPCIGNPSYYRGFRKHWDATFGNRFPWDAAWCWAARVRVVKP